MQPPLFHFFHPVLHSVPGVDQSIFDCVAHGDAAGEVGEDNSVGAFTTIHESRISYGPSFHIQTSYDLWDFEDDILIAFVPVSLNFARIFVGAGVGRRLKRNGKKRYMGMGYYR